MSNFLIIESGSTKTDYLLVSTDPFKPETKKTGLGINPFTQSPSEIVAALSDAFEALGENDINKVFFYGPGLSEKAQRDIIHAYLLGAKSNLGHVEVNHDMLGAARGLCPIEGGIVLIFGTGSNLCLYNGVDIIHQATSLGWILGDEGSGAWIGKEILSAFLYDQLPQDLGSIFNISKSEALDRLYKQPSPNRWLASLVPQILQHRNHPYIKQVIHTGFQKFLTLHLSTLSKKEVHKNMYATGSIAHYLKDELSEVCTELGYTLVTTLPTPLEGLKRYHLANQ